MAVLLAVGLLWESHSQPLWAWWMSPDQRAQQLLELGDAAAAARLFSTAERQAYAYYRAGDYAQAARLWAQQPGPVGAFNRGAALAQLERYEQAAAQYRLALAARPDWSEAERNLALVSSLARRSREIEREDRGGSLSADDVQFNEDPDDSQIRARDQLEGGGDQGLSTEQRKALWLRRLDASPARFLRLKFARQLQRRQEAG
ncbi:hypothetical protein DV711_02055 [Motiliproteus coralliicola]|uniref:Tetratricopeptide repeat protein n=1 Tax=Motiliproteus coralliicola TaxID=2283196 RepID=A0A369WV18_9GAMM|nr:hypothetical protein DV711_02055 [Motiliproteus coralliicola]